MTAIHHGRMHRQMVECISVLFITVIPNNALLSCEWHVILGTPIKKLPSDWADCLGLVSLQFSPNLQGQISSPSGVKVS